MSIINLKPETIIKLRERRQPARNLKNGDTFITFHLGRIYIAQVLRCERCDVVGTVNGAWVNANTIPQEALLSYTFVYNTKKVRPEQVLAHEETGEYLCADCRYKADNGEKESRAVKAMVASYLLFIFVLTGLSSCSSAPVVEESMCVQQPSSALMPLAPDEIKGVEAAQNDPACFAGDHLCIGSEDPQREPQSLTMYPHRFGRMKVKVGNKWHIVTAISFFPSEVDVNFISDGPGKLSTLVMTYDQFVGNTKKL